MRLFALFARLLTLLTRAFDNIHKVNAAVTAGYEAWQGIYSFLSHLRPEQVTEAVLQQAENAADVAEAEANATAPPRPLVAL